MKTIKDTNLNVVEVTNENVFYSVMAKEIKKALDINDFVTTEQLVNYLAMRGFRADLALDTVKFMAFDIEELLVFQIEVGTVLVSKDSDRIAWLERQQEVELEKTKEALKAIQF